MSYQQNIKDLQGQIDKERAEFEAVQKEEQKVRTWFSTSPPQGRGVRDTGI